MLGLEIGSLIVKIILCNKVEDDFKKEIGFHFVDFAEKLGLDYMKAREFDRQFERMADKIAESCRDFFDKNDIESDFREMLLGYAYNALKKAYSVEKLMEKSQRNDIKLRDILLDFSKEDIKDFGQAELDLYSAYLLNLASIMIYDFNKLPALSSARIEYMMADLEEILKATDEILDELHKIDTKIHNTPEKNQTFEREYRKKIISKYSYVNVFGGDFLDENMRKYKLSTSYVQLEAEVDKEDHVISLSEVFEGRKNVWISGEAGSGKTTCLSWIAIESAKDADIKGIKGKIPVVIELRKYAGKEFGLIDCISNVMTNSSYRIPEGWLEDALAAGKILFLLDGFDEISEKERKRVFEWISEVDEKDRCIKLFTARPQVNNRPRLKNISEVKLLPMNSRKVQEFIRYWHRAVLVEPSVCTKDDAYIMQNRLIDLLERNDSLRKLASNPLLCAMICSLHKKSGMIVPKGKRDLYEACCKMLLEARDAERNISERGFDLTYEKKKLVLAKLAYYMMRNDYIEVEKNDAISKLEETLSSLGITNVSSEEFMGYLLERTGLLQEPEFEKISFVHKSFQEYLCANEISREKDWGVLEGKIKDDGWLETICIAIGYANKKDASKIVRKALEESKKAGNKKVFFYALEFLAGAMEVETGIREEVKNCLEAYIPPKKDRIYQISQAGNIAVHYLSYKKSYSSLQRKNCLLTLKSIGTVEALKESMNYLQDESSLGDLPHIAKFIENFSSNILEDEEIPRIIADYFIKISASKVDELIMPMGIIRVINLLSEEDRKILAKNIPSKMVIVDYNNRSDDWLYFDEFDDWDNYEGIVLRLDKNIADRIKELTCIGDFDDPLILKDFNNLESLYICPVNKGYSLYGLESYKNLKAVKKWEIVSLKNDEYVSGKDLGFLVNCDDLTLALFGNEAEIHFDGFSAMSELKKFTIVSPYASEYDYGELDVDDLERLKIYTEGKEFIDLGRIEKKCEVDIHDLKDYRFQIFRH